MKKGSVDYCKSCLSLTNEWLRFAEAKNGVLLGLSIGFSIGAGKEGLKLNPESNQLFSFYLIMAFLYFCLSALAAFTSFLPLLKILPLEQEQICATDNLLFFGDLKNYSTDGLITAWTTRNESNPSEISPICKDYAEQIVVNSAIAAKKYRIFEIGSWFLLSAFLTPLIVLALQILNERQRRKR